MSTRSEIEEAQLRRSAEYQPVKQLELVPESALCAELQVTRDGQTNQVINREGTSKKMLSSRTQLKSKLVGQSC